MTTQKFENLYEIQPSYAATLEGHIFRVTDRLTASDDNPYNGGQWLSKPIGCGWFFELQEVREWRVVNAENYSDVVVNTKVLSLAAFGIALSEFSSYLYSKTEDDKQVEALFNEVVKLHDNMMSSARLVLSDEEMETFSDIVD